MDVLLTSLPQLLELYIEDFISIFEFFLVFITVLRIDEKGKTKLKEVAFLEVIISRRHVPHQSVDETRISFLDLWNHSGSS